MGKMVRIQSGEWMKKDDVGWRFYEDSCELEHYIVTRNNEHVDAFMALVREELLISPTTPMVLTYRLPETILEANVIKSPPNTVLTTEDVEILLSIQEWRNEVIVYVTSGALRVAKFQFLCRTPFTLGDTTYLDDGITEEQHLAIITHKYKVNALPWEYRSQDARISDRISDQDWTGFHESKLNGGCHQSSLRKRALKIAASKSRFELFYWSLYESSLNGVTFQTCLKNPIPCIPSPKTSGYVRFSVGNQLWLLHTVQGKSTTVKDSVEGSMVKPSWSAMILGRIPLTTHGIANFPGSLFFVNVIMCFIFSLA
ncbi:hypothetical protein IGI04_035722 [Brassica rapa subsp. trilocularis]|uniref:Uncharacterized protein n=1 Tax=Brassica rapa subsp. trilocularis TaxID=1813537 RepID=A0ABQ7LDD3_BRACM|nr:hypothetical protein IGI04_035722 [Brassica rapa subsp. trilocularis]